MTRLPRNNLFPLGGRGVDTNRSRERESEKLMSLLTENAKKKQIKYISRRGNFMLSRLFPLVVVVVVVLLIYIYTTASVGRLYI